MIAASVATVFFALCRLAALLNKNCVSAKGCPTRVHWFTCTKIVMQNCKARTRLFKRCTHEIR